MKYSSILNALCTVIMVDAMPEQWYSSRKLASYNDFRKQPERQERNDLWLDCPVTNTEIYTPLPGIVVNIRFVRFFTV